MDHLPWRHTDRPRPSVPYLCGHLTDSDICSTFEEFIAWPEKMGWSFDADDVSALTLATNCQSWLFFGIIRIWTETTSQPFCLVDYITSDDPPLVNTARLLNKMFDTERRAEAGSIINRFWFPDTSANRPRVLSVLAPARTVRAPDTPIERDDQRAILTCAQCWILRWIQRCQQRDGGCHHRDNSNFKVFWSTAMLYQELFTSLMTRPDRNIFESAPMLYQDLFTNITVKAEQIAEILSAQTFVKDEIKLAGKCPTLARRKRLSLLDTWTLLATPLLAQRSEDTHGGSHDRCSDQGCKAFDISKDQYSKRHSPTCNSNEYCRLRGPKITTGNDLCTLIHRNAIPLVRSTVDEFGIRIAIVDGDEIEDFTAISHVWAGGLGNFDKNELYECQLVSLHMTLCTSKRLKSTVYYWLDTLCVPLDNDDRRLQAISEMARIYATARSVLVLDPVLQYTNIRGLTHHEAAVMIAVSPWMARSWPLQEGALAVDLSIQFRDSVLSFADIESHGGPLTGGKLGALWKRDVDRLEDMPSKALAIKDRLLAVWQELSQRTTMEPKHIAGIIAVFIDRSAGEILNLDACKQVHALLRSQPYLPTCMFFIPAEDTINSWQPKLPRFDGKLNDLKSTTYLRLTTDRLWQASDFRDLYILRCVDRIPLFSSVLIKEHIDGHIFELTFSDQATSQTGKQPLHLDADVLLVLPRWSVDQELTVRSQKDYPGLAFVMRPSIETAELASFRRTFRWKLYADEEAASLTNPHSSPSERRCVYRAARFPPWTGQLPDLSCQLMFDMGLQESNGLSWSRKKSYPMIQHSVYDGRLIALMDFCSKASYCIIFGRTLLWLGAVIAVVLIKIIFDTADAALYFKVLVGLFFHVSILISNSVIRNAEIVFMKHHSRILLQRLWATSFATSTQDKSSNFLASKPHKRRALALIGCYTMVSVLAFAIAPFYFLHSNKIVDRDSNNPNGYLPKPGVPLLSLGFAVFNLVAQGYFSGGLILDDSYYGVGSVFLDIALLHSVYVSLEIFLRVIHHTKNFVTVRMGRRRDNTIILDSELMDADITEPEEDPRRTSTEFAMNLGLSFFIFVAVVAFSILFYVSYTLQYRWLTALTGLAIMCFALLGSYALWSAVRAVYRIDERRFIMNQNNLSNSG